MIEGRIRFTSPEAFSGRLSLPAHYKHFRARCAGSIHAV
jgi:hypothetical protein